MNRILNLQALEAAHNEVLGAAGSGTSSIGGCCSAEDEAQANE